MPRHRSLTFITAAALAGLTAAGLGACSDEPERDESTGEITEAGDADVFSMQVGDCLTDNAIGDVSEVPVVPCTEAHTSEVFYSHTIEDGDFPGSDGLTTIGEQACIPAFEQFVGVPYEASVLDVTTLEPTADSWEQGDRELLCLIYDPAGDTVGTLEASAR
ncbi:MAG TPA: septum formation family protein [Acidimicrobiales bacterium]|nr:septum formation family protein [Acidimicrobiales bacterium]